MTKSLPEMIQGEIERLDALHTALQAEGIVQKFQEMIRVGTMPEGAHVAAFLTVTSILMEMNDVPLDQVVAALKALVQPDLPVLTPVQMMEKMYPETREVVH